jgi:hypothetical protein
MLWIYKSWGAKVYFLKKKIETKQKKKKTEDKSKL